jgi:hypothetical protein
MSAIAKFFQRNSQSRTKTVLDTAGEAIRHKDYLALSATAREIGALCRKKPYLLEPLLVIAGCLGQCPEYVPEEALGAAKLVASQAPRDSALSQQAVALIVKYVATFVTYDPIQALEDITVAMQHARQNSELHTQALDVAMVAVKTREAAGNSALDARLQYLHMMKTNPPAPPPFSSFTTMPSRSAAHDFVNQFQPDSGLSLPLDKGHSL